MPKKLKPEYKNAKYLKRCVLPQCRRCGQFLIAVCDKSKPSLLVRFKGTMETKTKPQFMWMFPTADEQSSLCPYCEDRLHPLKAGKES